MPSADLDSTSGACAWEVPRVPIPPVTKDFTGREKSFDYVCPWAYLGYMTNAIRKYTVTRTFTAGTLKGLTYTEVTSVEWKVGQRVDKPVGGSPYVITDVRLGN